MVARLARHAEISASVSDCAGPTSTNTAEPHTRPRDESDVGEPHAPQPRLGLRIGGAPIREREPLNDRPAPADTAAHQPKMRKPETCGQAMMTMSAAMSRAERRRPRVPIQHRDALLFNASQECGVHVSCWESGGSARSGVGSRGQEPRRCAASTACVRLRTFSASNTALT